MTNKQFKVFSSIVISCSFLFIVGTVIAMFSEERSPLLITAMYICYFLSSIFGLIMLITLMVELYKNIKNGNNKIE